MALLDGVPIDNGSDADDDNNQQEQEQEGDSDVDEHDDLSHPKREVVEIRYASYDREYWKSRIKLIVIGFLYFAILNIIILMIGFWICPDVQILGFEILKEIFKWIWYMILLVIGFFYVSNVTEQRCLYRELVVAQQNNTQSNDEFSIEEFGHVFWIKHFFTKIILSVRRRSFGEFSKYYLQDREGTCNELINLLSPRSFKLVENRKRLKRDIFVYFPIYLFGVMSCIETSASTAFSYFLNNGLFFIAYYIGLQFTYLDKIEFLQLFGDRIANSNRWKEIRIYEWIGVLISGIVLILLIALQIFTFLTLSGFDILIGYALGYLFFLLFVSIVYISLSHVRKTHYLHMHHYFLFLVIIPLFRSTGYFNIGTMCSGLCLGIFVEGISRWGMHGILIER